MVDMLQFLWLLGLCSFNIPILQSLPTSTDVIKQAKPDFAEGSEGYIVVAGGALPNNDNVANCYAYDINAGTWAALPDLPAPRYGGSLVAHQGNLYYVSGRLAYGRDDTKEVLGLVTEQNKWIEGPPLQEIKGSGVNAVSLNGSLYALGGYSNYLERLDSCSGTYFWTQKATTLQKHAWSGAAMLNGYIYVCGTAWEHPSTFCERYDPAADTWTAVTPMNEARTDFPMVALNRYLYVIGGADANNERYDPIKDEWTYFSNFPNNKYDRSAATDGKNIYVVGGGDGIPDVNVYLPEFDLWQLGNPYPISIHEAGVAFVKSLP